MKKKQLNFRFHNPNTAEAAADFLLKLLVEVNRERAEQIVAAARREEERQPPAPKGGSET